MKKMITENLMSGSKTMSDNLSDRIAELLIAHPMGLVPVDRTDTAWPWVMAAAIVAELGLQPHLAKRIINGKPDRWVRRYTTDWEIVDE